MSLTTRLLVYFQTALAVVLLVFCATLYFAARWYVLHQATDTAERAAATLVASVDIEPDSVEWEPSDRDVSVGSAPLGGSVCWHLTDARGNPVDRSPSPGTADLVAAGERPESQGWIVTRRLVHPPGATGEQLTRDRTSEEVEKGEYPALAFTAGVRTEPLHSALSTLALGLAGVSFVVWLVALAAGRWMCRRALRPVTDMAESARTMDAEDVGSRLPTPGARGELEDLHAAMSGLLERLHAALGRERRFTAEASHQLRTPLGTILGQVDVALRKPRSPEEYERVLGVVRRQAIDLTRCVEALLFLARSDSDTPPPPSEPIDLGRWLPDFLAAYAPHPRHADVTLRDEADAPVIVAVHPPLLRELVGNLLDNALKYSNPGTPVVLRIGVAGGSAIVAVEDRGAGIPPVDLPHVFEPFFRSAAAATKSGSGLGLVVVARVAAAFGGRVIAENRADGGAGFTVFLPLRQDEEDFIPASPTH